MAVQKKFALGRGLDALISNEEVKTSGSSSINEIELSKISVNPNQPRREFDPIALQELADSIAYQYIVILCLHRVQSMAHNFLSILKVQHFYFRPHQVNVRGYNV